MRKPCIRCGSLRVGVIASRQKVGKKFNAESAVTAQAVCHGCGARTKVFCVENGCGENEPVSDHSQRVALLQNELTAAKVAVKGIFIDAGDPYRYVSDSDLRYHGHGPILDALFAAEAARDKEIRFCAGTDEATAFRKAVRAWDNGEVVCAF